jgi:hypothetical protein
VDATNKSKPQTTYIRPYSTLLLLSGLVLMMARTTKRVVTRRVASAAGAAAAGAAAAGGVKCQAVHSTAKKPRNAPIPKTTEQANAGNINVV